QRLGLLPGPAGDCATAAAIELMDDERVRFHDPRVRVDFGGIAKGFAVDRAVAALRDHGMPQGVVNAGGDLAAFAPTPERGHVRDPRGPRRVIGAVAIHNEALASSGGSFDPSRSADADSCAIIEPAAGGPVRAIAGASVRAPSCMIADALTKVVMIAGMGAAD